MEEAKKERATAKGQFTRAEDSLSKALEGEDVPVSTIERRFGELQRRWEKVQITHDA